MIEIEKKQLSSHGQPLQIEGLDHIELYVGNINLAMHFFRTAFGFSPVAYAGLETGVRDRASYLIEQGDIRLVLTGPINQDCVINEHLKLHGDSVKEIAFRVNDVSRTVEAAVSRGAKVMMEPTVLELESGRIVKSTIAAFGDTVHSFVQREPGGDGFLPGYKKISKPAAHFDAGLKQIDHLAINTELGKLEELVEFYTNVLGLQLVQCESIATEYSGMNIKVVETGAGQVKLTLVEPAIGKRQSQIEEFLRFNHGPGVQHLAMSSTDIVRTVRILRENGVEFVSIPRSYYDGLEHRIGKIKENLSSLKDLNILADRDGSGYLLQIFTNPVPNRPTFFLEVIQRSGSAGFGAGNIKALFQAVEKEQAMRGNL